MKKRILIVLASVQLFVVIVAFVPFVSEHLLVKGYGLPTRVDGLNKGGIRVFDLTHPLLEGIPAFPGSSPFFLEKVADYKDGYFANRFCSPEHFGTHLDAPAHFIKGGATVDALSPSTLVSSLVLVNLREKVRKQSAYAVRADDFRQWEREHRGIREGDVVVLHTGWADRWGNPQSYRNEAGGVMQFPGLSEEGARFLVSRGVRGVGIDTLSIDPGPSQAFAAHRILMEAGIYAVENLANLAELPFGQPSTRPFSPAGGEASEGLIVIAPLPIKGGSGSPCRVFALFP